MHGSCGGPLTSSGANVFSAPALSPGACWAVPSSKRARGFWGAIFNARLMVSDTRSNWCCVNQYCASDSRRLNRALSATPSPRAGEDMTTGTTLGAKGEGAAPPTAWNVCANPAENVTRHPPPRAPSTTNHRVLPDTPAARHTAGNAMHSVGGAAGRPVGSFAMIMSVHA